MCTGKDEKDNCVYYFIYNYYGDDVIAQEEKGRCYACRFSVVVQCFKHKYIDLRLLQILTLTYLNFICEKVHTNTVAFKLFESMIQCDVH